MEIKKSLSMIEGGDTVLGIELGSTRIKAVLIGEDHNPMASGGFAWENSLTNGIWTYSIEQIWEGLRACYADLAQDVRDKYGVTLSRIKAMGFSAMMHGYMVFDSKGNQLTPFRTWRNNITGAASEELTALFNYPIPQRWSIAHLYHAVLNNEAHVKDIAFMTTLAGYIHWKLTGQKELGIGDASGMFPIDLKTKGFNMDMCALFDNHIKEKNIKWRIRDILPEVLCAGEGRALLTDEGALLLDPSGVLNAGVPVAPPEGDAGTGMAATNSVAIRTGNVSAGTSVFAMIVLEKELKKVHHEVDLVTTPDGHLVGMAHSNNCSTDYDAWINLFGEVLESLGKEISRPLLYDTLLEQALKGEPDCGGLMSYGYVSGEHITGFTEGRPLFVRSPEAQFNLANFMRTNLFTSLCALRTGLNILFNEEGVRVDEIKGHGGFFKSPDVGQKIMAAATGTPVSTLKTAGEGGAWGMALLAAFMIRKDKTVILPEFLEHVFCNSIQKAVKPDSEDIRGFNKFLERYHRGLAIEKAAVTYL
ncbi:MAG: FGGY-family carbohydrate kinase [Deltaproteobacteria bacterium]|nr:FGGY-family carbohydrate kinase [Deltaproteobacteria bacterium]